MRARQLTESFRRWRSFNGAAVDLVDIQMMFPRESLSTIRISLTRHAKAEHIVRVTNGIYCLPDDSRHPFLLEHTAAKKRRGSFCYVSQESYLSEIGVMPQQMHDQLTVMTEGRSGVYSTIAGTLYLRHTKRQIVVTQGNFTCCPERRLYLPCAKIAYEDLRGARRNLQSVNMDKLEAIMLTESSSSCC